MKVEILVLFIVVFKVIGVQGSTLIKGKVIDASNGEPLTGVVVQVRNTTLHTITGSDGSYDLTINHKSASCHIHCSCLGYTSEDTIVSTNIDIVEINFSLQPDIIDLNSVVVTGNRAERKLKDVPMITQVVTTHEIEKVGAVNLQEALEMAIPGLEFQQEGYGTNLKMQGLDGKYVLVLIDGERMAGETRGNIDYSRLNAANVQRIEVVRGASSSLYGSKAIGGVINIITKTNYKKGTNISLNSRFSRFNEFSSGVTIGAGNNKLSNQTDIQFKRSDGYDLSPELTPSDKTQEAFDNIHIRQKFAYTISSSWNISLLAAYFRHEEQKLVSTLKQHRLNYDYTLGFKSNWYLKEKHNMEFVVHTDQYETYRQQHTGNFQKGLEYQNRIITPRITGDFKLSENNRLTAGIEFFNDHLNGIAISGDKNFSHYLNNDSIERISDNNIFLFVQDEHLFFKRLQLTAGFRIEHYERFQWHFVPAVSLKFDASPFVFRGNIGAGYKAPSLKELYMNYVIPGMGDIHIIGNPELTPEESLYASISSEFINKKNRLSLILFHNRLENMIRAYIPEHDTKYMTYENVARVNTTGFDVLFETNLFNCLKTGGGYSLNISEDLINKRPLNDVSRHSLRFSSGLSILKRTEFPVTINLMCKWYGKKYRWITTEQELRELAHYAIWTFSVVGRYKNRLNVIAGMDNILNYIGVDHSTAVYPGTKPFISLRYDFKIKNNKN